MSSPSFNVGSATAAKPSSRVLKPPGGGSSNIFGEPDHKELQPRNSKNQQNSSSMNEVMGTVDPNIRLNTRGSEVVEHAPSAPVTDRQSSNVGFNMGPAESDSAGANQRARVPPGGFSSGLW